MFTGALSLYLRERYEKLNFRKLQLYLLSVVSEGTLWETEFSEITVALVIRCILGNFMRNWIFGNYSGICYPLYLRELYEKLNFRKLQLYLLSVACEGTLWETEFSEITVALVIRCILGNFMRNWIFGNYSGISNLGVNCPSLCHTNETHSKAHRHLQASINLFIFNKTVSLMKSETSLFLHHQQF
jgi:hypothetical protein